MEMMPAIMGFKFNDSLVVYSGENGPENGGNPRNYLFPPFIVDCIECIYHMHQ
jgi:hypothetical protein